MIRKIIQIDEAKCNGCGLCIPNCPEGALQIIDGKARLVSDLFCDGLGACMGHCPEGAIEVIEREAEPYDEYKVMDIIAPQGRNTILAHLDHLRSHHEEGYLREAIAYIKAHQIDMSPGAEPVQPSAAKPAVFANIRDMRSSVKPASSCGCPGNQSQDYSMDNAKPETPLKAAVPFTAPASSQLNHWPVQMHLINPMASQYRNADLLLAADCVAFAMGDFHSRLLSGKSLAIACPKLDSNMDVYVSKLSALISQAAIRSLTVAVMEVPCCSGLIRLVSQAIAVSGHPLTVRKITVSTRGEILREESL